MSLWDAYFSRLNARDGDRRSAVLQREQRFLNAKLPASLSYHQAVINGEHRSLAIINSDNLNQKTLCTLPGETLPHGGLVEWMDNRWLITELDANNEVYSKGIMRQCNYQLRWIADDGTIVERWCIIEDGTKLKHIAMCNSLVYWKRYAKRIPLIAGNPLEPNPLQRGFEIRASAIA